MNKRFSSMILILCMWCAFSISVSAASTPSDWAVTEVNAAIQEGLVTDKIIKDYQKAITREEFCELVVKLYEKLTSEEATIGSDPFSDTDNTEILKAYSLGIVKGVSNNEFAPENKITRQEICVMLTRCIDIAIDGADITSFEINLFVDGNNIADWALDYVNYAYDNEIIKGVGKYIDPLGNTTCEQAVLLVYRTVTFGEKYTTHDGESGDCSIESTDEHSIWSEFLKSGEYAKYTKDYDGTLLEYVIADLNADNIPELLIQYNDFGWTNTWTFALNNDDVVLVRADYGYGEYHYSPKFNLIIGTPYFKPFYIDQGAGYTPFYKLNGTEIEDAFSIVYDMGQWFYSNNSGDKAITEAEKDQYLDDAVSFEWKSI